MLSRPKVGIIPKERYGIIQMFGSVEDNAAYLATDLFNLGQWISWESAEIFGLKTRPPGIPECYEQDDGTFAQDIEPILRLAAEHDLCYNLVKSQA